MNFIAFNDTTLKMCYYNKLRCLLSGTDWKHIALPSHIETIQGYGMKVSGILDMIHRNCMKVAFFGR